MAVAHSENTKFEHKCDSDMSSLVKWSVNVEWVLLKWDTENLLSEKNHLCLESQFDTILHTLMPLEYNMKKKVLLNT